MTGWPCGILVEAPLSDGVGTSAADTDESPAP